MVRVLALLVVASFLITGCTRMDVYTFKKERVDQSLKGNQGYIVGEKPETPEVQRDTKRTLFGLDVELPDFSRKKRGSEQETKKETGEAPAPRKAEPRAKKAEPQRVKTMKVQPKKVETEEDWIK